MIATVCLNPAFDRTASVVQFIPGGTNRLSNISITPGGKGINVGVALKRFGVETQCIGCLGAENRADYLALLEKTNLSFFHVLLSGKVRTNLKIWDKKENCVTELNESGPKMNVDAQELFASLLEENTKNSQYVVFSGSLPEGCSADFYRYAIQKTGNARCILDASGEAFRQGILANPFLVKPNLNELEQLFQKRFSTLAEIRDAALTLWEKGVKNVLVSMGKEGAIWAVEGEAYFARGISVKVRSTVGAGDAMLAGFLMALTTGRKSLEVFSWAVAAGTASVMTENSLSLEMKTAEKLLSKVVIQKI